MKRIRSARNNERNTLKYIERPFPGNRRNERVKIMYTRLDADCQVSGSSEQLSLFLIGC